MAVADAQYELPKVITAPADGSAARSFGTVT